MRFGIANKVNFFIICIIILFTVLIGFYFVQHEKRALSFELDERATALLNNLCLNSEYPVLIKNYEALSKLGKGILVQKDIIFCEILDKDGNILFQEGSKKERTIREYNSFIVTEKIADKEAGEELILGVEKKIKEEIGKVFLSVSLAGLNQKVSGVQKTVAIASIIFIIAAIFLSSLLLRFILSRPIDGLVTGTRKIATGDLNYKVPVKTKDEIGELATKVYPIVKTTEYSFPQKLDRSLR